MHYLQVTIVLEKKDFLRLLKEIKAKPILDSAFICEDNDETMVSINWYDIKWFNGFEDIRFLEDFINNIENSYILKIGEELHECFEELNGENYDLTDMARINRFININGKEVPISKYENMIKKGVADE